MQFRTELHIPAAPYQMDAQTSIVTIGSCFADVVGQRLQADKLNVWTNELGTLFSPLAIDKAIKMALGELTFDERLFIQNQEQWFHYDFHSSQTNLDKESLRQQIQTQLVTLRKQLLQADFLILTLGTAFAYRLHTPPTYVANCHKTPATFFDKDLLHVKQICKALGESISLLQANNPNLHIVLTVSPIRHTKDGIPENQVSKSILRAACHYLTTDYDKVTYFPAYELMMDDLRDYRFYEADLIHPNEIATQYIYEKFCKSFFSIDLLAIQAQWQKLQKALAHRPFNPHSVAHQAFLQNLLTDLQNISTTICVDAEIAELKNRLG
jgi:GSCFA family